MRMYIKRLFAIYYVSGVYNDKKKKNFHLCNYINNFFYNVRVKTWQVKCDKINRVSILYISINDLDLSCVSIIFYMSAYLLSVASN